MLEEKYNPSEWVQAYTDGSADGAVRNGGSGVYTRFPSNTSLSTSVPVGVHSTNFTAELTALHKAAEMLYQKEHYSSKVVFLTDCRSVIQRLQSPKEPLERKTLHLLACLSEKMQVAVQWLPAHCGLLGNERADGLAKKAPPWTNLPGQSPSSM